jgi:hypothetical protein
MKNPDDILDFWKAHQDDERRERETVWTIIGVLVTVAVLVCGIMWLTGCEEERPTIKIYSTAYPRDNSWANRETTLIVYSGDGWRYVCRRELDPWANQQNWMEYVPQSCRVPVTP